LFGFGAMSKSGKDKPRKQRGATFAIGDDDERVVAHLVELE